MTAKAIKEGIILPEIRKIVREELEATNRNIDDLRIVVDERFKAVNERLDAIKERYDVTRDVAILQAKVKEMEGKVAGK